MGIDWVGGRAGELTMRFSPLASLDLDRLVEALHPYEGQVRLRAGKENALVYVQPGKGLEEMLRSAVKLMAAVAPQVAPSAPAP